MARTAHNDALTSARLQDPSIDGIRFDDAWPPRAHARFAVFALGAAFALASFDRAIITLVGEPLRRDLGITDGQFGILAGLAFAVPLALLGVPAGRLADRMARKVVLLGGLTVWSAMTGLCGAVKSLGALLAARVGVGAGEAAISPTAVPIIADYFAPGQRSRAIAVYFLGTHLGQASALILGGALLFRLDRLAPRQLQVIGMVYGWQLLFPIAAAAGLVVAALLFAMREPPRRELMRAGAQARGLPLREVAAFVRKRAGAFSVILLAPTLLSIGFHALLVFLPTLFQRAHGLPVDRAGAMIGAVGLPAAIGGTLLAGVLGDRVMQRTARGGHALLLAWAILLAVPFCIAVPLAPSGGLAVAALGGGLIFYSISLTVPSTAIQVIAPNQMRGQLVGALSMFVNMVGYGLGPVLVGFLSDRLSDLPLALAILVGVTYPLAALVAFSGVPAYDRVAREAAAARDRDVHLN